MNKACHIGSLIRIASQFSLQRLAPFSSSSAAIPRFPNSSTDEDESEAEEIKESSGSSTVYRHVLKTQRPATIYRQRRLENSVSFIGTVDRPLMLCNRKSGCLGVYTLLKVRNHYDSNRTFRILVKMWDEMAKICMEHLKPNDFIYVSGHLETYMKADVNGGHRLNHNMVAKELYYVTQHDQGPTFKKHEWSQSDAYQKSEKLPSVGVGTDKERYKNYIYLWQVFFTNPHEWWDNRKNKKNSRQPDFKHKDTGEALWLSPNDPPWVKRQLQILDLRMSEQWPKEGVGSHSRVSRWVYDG